ncbi:amidase [Veronia pacifica]|uniref:amidase n=1 Tax=Veronia pacifica TaxID=1080227 RepID=UPI000A525722|nr:amidase [Veronia pacifica]
MNTKSIPLVNAYCDDVLASHDAVALAQLIDKKEISPQETISAAIERAKKVNPHLNAITEEMYSDAVERMPSSGLMYGVPSFIKDNEAVKGFPTLHGSAALKNTPAEHSSDFFRQFESLGLATIGKSTLPEFGLTATTESTFLGETKNPWNTAFSSGGSSGGSAALVAAGVVPIAHGNDGGGSIRIPAACCGLVGLKPTRGRLRPMEGTDLLPINLVNQGVLTRTVRDTATFLYGAELHHANPDLPPIGHVQGEGKKPLKIAFFINGPEHVLTDSDCGHAVRKAASLCESLGHDVEEIPFPFDHNLGDDFLIYWSMLAFGIHYASKQVVGQAVDKSKLEPFTKAMSRYYLTQCYKTPGAIRRLKQFQATYQHFFDNVDVILSPVLGHPPPKLSYLVSKDINLENTLERLRRFVPFTGIQNVSGGPAVSLPVGMSQTGLPVGVQFASAPGNDKTLLELAFGLEQTGAFLAGDDKINKVVGF